MVAIHQNILAERREPSGVANRWARVHPLTSFRQRVLGAEFLDDAAFTEVFQDLFHDVCNLVFRRRKVVGPTFFGQ